MEGKGEGVRGGGGKGFSVREKVRGSGAGGEGLQGQLV